MTRFERKERCINSMGDEKLFAKVDTTKMETRSRPHFELHTQSSLMKRKEPRQCSMMDLKLKKVEGSRICKRRSDVEKQNKNMQALKTILMGKKDSCEVFSSLSDKLIKTAHSLKDCSNTSLQSGLILFGDLVKWTGRLSLPWAGIEVDSQDKIAQTEGDLEKSQVSFRDDQTSEPIHDIQRDTANSPTSTSLQDNCTRNVFTSIENHPFVETRRGSQLQLSDDDLQDYKVKIHHALTSRRKVSEDGYLNGEYFIESQACRHSILQNVTRRNRPRKARTSETATIQSGDIVAGIDHSCDLGDSKITKFTKRIDNTQLVKMSRQKKYAGKNVASNLPVWKPAGISKVTSVESTASLTQKSSRSTMRSITLGNNQQQKKYPSAEYAGQGKSLDSESTKMFTSRKHFKSAMKENKDPRADPTLKSRERPVETRSAKDVKQRGMSNGGTLSRNKRRSMTKVVCNNSTSVSGKYNDAKPRDPKSRSRSKSKSRRWQLQSIMRKNSSKSRQDIDDNRAESASTYKKRSSPLEVMHTLKKIINSSRNNEDLEENAKISTNEKTSKSIRTVSTQTWPRCKKNIGTECNTMPYAAICKDAEVSCDIIGSTSSKTDVDPSAIENELVSEDISIHTIVGPRPVEYTNTDDENECFDVTERLLISEYDKTLIGDSTELESRISVETTATSAETVDANHVFGTETKTIVGKEREIEEIHEDEIPLKSSENYSGSMRTSADEHEESTKCLYDYDVIGGSANDLLPEKPRWTPLSLYEYDASCSNSSEEATEHLENNICREEAVTPELEVDSIPSDVLVAFQIAAEYACNLHKAVLLYKENLMAQESERQRRAANEARGTSMLGEDRCCVSGSSSFLSCRSNEDLDKFSARSSSSRGSLHLRQLGPQNFRPHRVSCPEINLEEENAVLPQSVEMSKLVQKYSDLMLVDVKSLMRLHRTREEHALEVLRLEEFAEDGDKANGMAVSVVSREYWVPLIYCFICTLAFWCLQFSFTCNSAQ